MENYKETIKQLSVEGVKMPKKRFCAALPNARQIMRTVLEQVCEELGEKAEWLPEYEGVANWLADNHGKGLLLYGSCGRGKSLLVRYVIPIIFRRHYNRIFTVVNCSRSAKVDVSEVLQRRFVVLDDIGAEEVQSDYGTKRNVVSEMICTAHDEADRLIIASTNLNGDELRERYGNRIYDRMIYLFDRIGFAGESLRK